MADLAREDGARSVVESAVRDFGRLDCLVNNAGDSGPTKPVQEYSLEDWSYTLDSCLTSSYLCCRFAVPALIAAGGGAIVNITGMAGRRGMPFRAGYCAAKGGQLGLTYGRLIDGLSKAGIEVDRKVLSDLAVHEPAAFAALADKAKAALAYLKDQTPNEFERAVRQ